VSSWPPPLPPKLQETLDALRAAGIEPTAEELVGLAVLRQPCDSPRDGSISWVIGAPITFGGVDWYPMHRLAESWWMRAHRLLDGNDLLQMAAFLYAHAKSAPGDVSIRDHMTLADIETELAGWLNSLACHDEAMGSLCERLRLLDGNTDEIVPDLKKETDDKKEETVDHVEIFLVAMQRAFPGVPPSFWMTELPANEERKMLAQVSADGLSFAESPGRRSAIANYLRAVKWVWLNHGKIPHASD